MSRVLRILPGALALMLMLLPGTMYAAEGVTTLYATSSGDSSIVNGWWDDVAGLVASSPGEMSIEIANVVSGVPRDSMKAADTVIVDKGYAMSSLESLLVADDTVSNTPYDTVYFRYIVQNQGNTTDSIYAYAAVHDTSDGNYFTPVAFHIVKDTVGTDSIVGLDFDTSKVDTAWYGVRLAQEAVDTFYARFVIPGPSNAADGDSLLFTMRLQDNLGSGTYDAWPGTTAAGEMRRTVLDTFTTHHLIHLHGDTLWEYGDDQSKTTYMTINSPTLRLRKKVTEQSAGNTYPGDTLIYTIYYDNDGSSETEDTATVIDVLPRGVAFLDTFKNAMDTNPYFSRGAGSKVKTYYRVNTGAWLEDMPGTNDSLLQITALKFAIPPGIGLHDTTGEAGSGSKVNVVADGDSLDSDAGYMTFKVRIR